MKRVTMYRLALIASVVALLAGCGGSQPPIRRTGILGSKRHRTFERPYVVSAHHGDESPFNQAVGDSS